MEENGLLNMDNNLIEKFVLQFVFLFCINRVIISFKIVWNYYFFRIEYNWSLQRIWLNGMVDIRNCNLIVVVDVVEVELVIDDLEWYGFDLVVFILMDEELFIE